MADLLGGEAGFATDVVTLVERPGLQARLEAVASRRIWVLVGAAGWGKTTAVAATAREHPTAWMQCDDQDADPRRFLRRLVEVLAPHLPASRLQPAEGELDGTDDLGSAVDAVCHCLRRSLRETVVLVIDDLQGLAPDDARTRIVERLCQRLPDQVRLVLVSRRELPFSLARMRGRGLVAEIDAPELAFDVAEVAALLRASVGEAASNLAVVVRERTGGWAAAVHSAVELLRGVEPDHRLRALDRLSYPGERFHNYLVEEVLSSEPGWAVELMRRLAVLGEVKSTTWLGLGVKEAAARLAELTRRGLVRRSVQDRAGWSLVQPLADYFRYEIPTSSGDRLVLHATAARECAARGAHAEGLRHLLAAGAHEACAALLVDRGAAIVRSGCADVVLEAAELPSRYLDDARIQAVLGYARHVRGEWAQAMECYQRAGGDQAELDPALAWLVAWLAFSRGEFAEVLAVFGRTRLDRQGGVGEAMVIALAASAWRMVGDLDRAKREAARAQAAARQCGERGVTAVVDHVLAVLAGAEGDRRQAAVHCRDALQNAEAEDDLLLLAWIRNCRAFHHIDMGEPQQALSDAETVLDLAERCGSPFLSAHGWTTRARACVRLGRLDDALTAFQTAVDIFQRLGSRFLAWPLCGLGDLYRTKGQLARARAAYEEALTMAEPSHDVLGLGLALIGLARVRAVDDLALARSFAERAVALSEGLREVAAYLTRGWVALMANDRQSAARDAARAGTAARARRDGPGLAEAITLSVLCSGDPPEDSVLLGEAIELCQDSGCRLEEAAARLVAERLGSTRGGEAAFGGQEMLRQAGVEVESRHSAGPLASVARFAPSVNIQALGSFRVIRDGTPVPKTAWPSKKARELLKILVARRRAVPREQLMELLWPQADPVKSGNRLSVLLSMLRDVLQPRQEQELVTTDGGAIALDASHVQVDVEEFLRNADTALAAHRSGHPDAVAGLHAAAAAYTGDFLEDDPYHEWAAQLSEELRATHIAVLQALAARLRQTGDVDSVVRCTLQLLSQDPYDEEAHLELVTMLLNAGRLGEARRHYENYARRMREIGASPRPRPTMAPEEAPSRVPARGSGSGRLDGLRHAPRPDRSDQGLNGGTSHLQR